MLLRIMSKLILHNFTTKFTNLVLSFCFVTINFNQTNLNKKQTTLGFSFFTGMSGDDSTLSCSKKEHKILASQYN